MLARTDCDEEFKTAAPPETKQAGNKATAAACKKKNPLSCLNSPFYSNPQSKYHTSLAYLDDLFFIGHGGVEHQVNYAEEPEEDAFVLSQYRDFKDRYYLYTGLESEEKSFTDHLLWAKVVKRKFFPNPHKQTIPTIYIILDKSNKDLHYQFIQPTGEIEDGLIQKTEKGIYAEFYKKGFKTEFDYHNSKKIKDILLQKHDYVPNTFLPNGIALHLANFQRKYPQSEPIYLATNYYTVLDCAKLFIRANMPRLILVSQQYDDRRNVQEYAQENHCIAICMERISPSKIAIILVDSINDTESTEYLVNECLSTLSGYEDHTIMLLINEEQQQGGEFLCLFYALKNAQKMAKMSGLMYEQIKIIPEQSTPSSATTTEESSISATPEDDLDSESDESEKDEQYIKQTYSLPSNFLDMVRSPSLLSDHLSKRSNDEKADVLKKVMKKRAIGLFTTPVAVENTEFDPTLPVSANNPATVMKNKRVEYFQQKYLRRMEVALTTSSPFDRRICIAQHDARNLALIKEKLSPCLPRKILKRKSFFMEDLSSREDQVSSSPANKKIKPAEPELLPTAAKPRPPLAHGGFS